MTELTAAPILSTPAENLFDQVDPFPEDLQTARRTDDELRDVYEIARTAREIRDGQKRCVALQFPDSMLGDSPRIVGLLRDELAALNAGGTPNGHANGDTPNGEAVPEEKVYILADTSYSACCVDEVAAEHADADVVVHYGRSCLSPTSRLPVIYVFTKHPLDEAQVADAFAREYTDKDEAKVILMADVAYQDHVGAVYGLLQQQGYTQVLSTAVVHNPLGSIPNRRLVDGEGKLIDDAAVTMQDYAIFHISEPPTSLLLALATRVRAFAVFPTTASSNELPSLLAPSTMGLLGRRYAKVISMATAGIIGILVNTLSVSNYLGALDNIRKRIADAGKKSYVVVVGKLNAVKLANFAEVDGWVVVGCWESSLVEDDAGFYQPVVTPFELEMALMSDDERIWGLKWWGGLEGLTPLEEEKGEADESSETNETNGNGVEAGSDEEEEESEPPQFDLRTGRLVTTSRPMRAMRKTGTKKSTNGTNELPNGNGNSNGNGHASSAALTLRPKAELATIKGVVSPGAEYLRSQRTWQGLGTDFDPDEEASTLIEQGRGGIARGYAVGDERRT